MSEDLLFPDDIDDFEDEVYEDDVEEDIGYKIAPYFDSRLGEFLLNGNGQIITANGVEAWEQWCDIIMSTDRYNHEAYTDDIGIDYEAVIQADTIEEKELILETEISEALSVDPYGRTVFVQSIEFEWINSTDVIVRIDIVGADNEIITIEKEIRTAA